MGRPAVGRPGAAATEPGRATATSRGWNAGARSGWPVAGGTLAPWIARSRSGRRDRRGRSPVIAVQRKWLILSTVSLGSLMSTLDGSIVNVAMPSIQRDLGIDLTAVEWVAVAYLLVVGSLLLPFGRLGEVLTFRRVYLVGFAIFTVASVFCGASPSPGALVAFRAVQGVGAAMIMAMGPAIVARTFPATERGRALGLNGVSVSIGLTLGPVLGGILTQVGTWRAIFLINVPIGILAIIWAARVLPPRRRRARASRSTSGAPCSRPARCSRSCWRSARASRGAGPARRRSASWSHVRRPGAGASSSWSAPPSSR